MPEAEDGSRARTDDPLPPVAQKKRRRRALASLFLLALAIYLLTTSGEIQTTDYAQEVKVAASMASGHGFVVAEPVIPGGGVQRGSDGRTYAAHDLGTSLLIYPLAKLVPGSVAGGQPTDRLSRLASLLDPVASAVSVVLFASILLELGVALTATVLAALAVAFASITWPFAHISFDVTIAATFVLLAVWGLARMTTRCQGRGWWALVGGVGAAAAICIRIDSAFVVAALSVAVLATAFSLRRRPLAAMRVLCGWSAPVLAAVGLFLWYNWVRFGAVGNSGHGGDPNTQTGSFVVGFLGQLVSPGRGLIFFSPLILVALFGWRSMYARNRFLTVAVLLGFLAALCAHAPLLNWSGDDTWGPRFLVPVATLALLPLGFAIEAITRWLRQPARVPAIAVVVAIVAVAVGVQVVGASTQYLWAKGGDTLGRQALGLSVPGIARPESRPQALHDLQWGLAHAQIIVDGRSLVRGLSGSHPYRTVTQSGIAPPVQAPVHWWWAEDLAANKRVIEAVLGPSLLLILAAASALVLSTALRGDDRPRSALEAPGDREVAAAR